MSAIHLVMGGIRSGKSAHAEQLAADTAGDGTVVYVATGVATDPEMAERIRRHVERRPDSWQTVEAPLNPVGALAARFAGTPPPPTLLLDSLDGWVSNLMFEHEGMDPAELEARTVGAVRRLIKFTRDNGFDAIIVSSEVGQSPVALSALGRQFQDLLGAVNQAVAAAADRVTLVVAGIPVAVKPPASAG